jgi:hypothetical protein
VYSRKFLAEVVSENQIIAPTGRIYGVDGQIIKNFTDGLPAKVTFDLPKSSTWFELEVAGRRDSAVNYLSFSLNILHPSTTCDSSKV